ncbi:Metallo-hydrolase/oxidoreductase [Didymella exigua CBS 183.55]|uniref:Metallo-hydrolase/oxidoreductase n=1 Tax=Didymella exigua CBS 183.55 TaxID=1150837 RepID=A0A6A5RNB4_9PLEO|nr:Metallo-hydrolase/oxidoreductase [Didymella exigua CBS 183.55]KAF1928790.1 Metallo-hydrolase/oxidoreductase [Didymella exigua CBS 183.55]
MSEPIIQPIFELTTGTFQYTVTGRSSRATVIIDPVLDFDPCTSSISTKSADTVLSVIHDKHYKVEYILESHAHADHLSSASYLQAQLSKTSTRPQIGIGKGINQVQAIHLPGHTPDHIGYSIGSNVFWGSSLFRPFISAARTDFPGGSAIDLWSAAQKLLALPDDTKIWVGHDYLSGVRAPVPFMTVSQHNGENSHVKMGLARDEFVKMRQNLQINIRGRRLPKVDEGGRMILSVPLKTDGVNTW